MNFRRRRMHHQVAGRYRPTPLRQGHRPGTYRLSKARRLDFDMIRLLLARIVHLDTIDVRGPAHAVSLVSR